MDMKRFSLLEISAQTIARNLNDARAVQGQKSGVTGIATGRFPL
jgi:hypothetical protein